MDVPRTNVTLSQLALKHRQNKSQRQRIIVFVCSPIDEDEKRLVSLAKKMKKGNTSIDFVFFGDLDDEATQRKLEAFNKAVKAGEGSHLVTVSPSSKLLSDQLISTPIVSGEAGGAGAGPSGGAGGAGAGGGEGGEGFDYVDPNMEPELALAIRMSLEEERARQEKAEKAAKEEEKKGDLGTVAEEGGEASGSGDKKDEDKKEKKDDDTMDTS